MLAPVDLLSITGICTSSVFTHIHTNTPGVDFYSKALKVDDRIVSLQLWDTAGQERFQSVTKAYYRGAQGVILMYDITQEESFIAVKSWINSIQVGTESHLTCIVMPYFRYSSGKCGADAYRSNVDREQA